MTRRVHQFFVVLTVLTLATWLGISLHTRDGKLALCVTSRTLPADGAFHQVAYLRLSGQRSLDTTTLTSSGLPTRIVSEQPNTAIVWARSSILPGPGKLILKSPQRKFLVSLQFLPDTNDSFGDGMPDILRLHTSADQTSFRRWFASLADNIAALPAQQVPREVDDCAALLRWCYRNALHAHDEAWQQTMPAGIFPASASVAQYAYPDTPLGAALFRVRAGRYQPADATDGSFAQFADARSLWRYNTFLVSRDLRDARPGDILFYRQLEQNSQFHSMILTGNSRQWAVYDTGPIGDGPAELRRVALDDPVHHPDQRWRPIPSNSNFLGVYRWDILREDLR